MADQLGGLIILIEGDASIAKPFDEVVPTIKTKTPLVLQRFATLSEFGKWLIPQTPSASTAPPAPAATAAPAAPAVAAATPAVAEPAPADPAAPVTKVTPLAKQIQLLVFAAENFKGRDDLEKFVGMLQPLIGREVPYLITTFEKPVISIPKWSSSHAFNVIEKPFDGALLHEHIKVAMKIEKSDDDTVFTAKTNAIIEMLKAVPMSAVSEVGFVTISDRPISEGKVTKFYGKIFTFGNVLSVFARTLGGSAGLPTTQDAAGNKQIPFAMTFFGTGRGQLLQIRSRFPKVKDLPASWRKAVPPAAANFAIIGDPSPAGMGLAGTLERIFTNATPHAMEKMPDLRDPVPTGLTAVLAHVNLIDALFKDDRFKDLPKIALADRTLTDEEFRRLANFVIDIVHLPVERVTFFKKMSVLFPQLALAEPNELHTFPWPESLDVGQTIEITQISEIGLVMKYERQLPFGDMRRFVLWHPMEIGTPILTGRCYKAEPDPTDATKALCHFVFYGMADHEIKHIRLWIRDNYIQAKQKG